MLVAESGRLQVIANSEIVGPAQGLHRYGVLVQALASLLYGLPSSGTLTLPAASNLADVSSVLAGFFQDNWKVTRKLTRNLGLRYELERPMTERYNRAVYGFDPTASQPFSAQVAANYAKNPTPEVSAAQFSVNGGLTFAGVNGNSRALYARAGKNNSKVYQWFNTSCFNRVSSQQLAKNLITLPRGTVECPEPGGLCRPQHQPDQHLLRQVTAQSNVPRRMQFTLRLQF